MKDLINATTIFLTLFGLALANLLFPGDGIASLAQFAGWSWLVVTWVMFCTVIGMSNNLRTGEGQKLTDAIEQARNLIEKLKGYGPLRRAWGWMMTVLLVGIYAYNGFVWLAALQLLGSLLIRLGKSVVEQEYQKRAPAAA